MIQSPSFHSYFDKNALLINQNKRLEDVQETCFRRKQWIFSHSWDIFEAQLHSLSPCRNVFHPLTVRLKFEVITSKYFEIIFPTSFEDQKFCIFKNQDSSILIKVGTMLNPFMTQTDVIQTHMDWFLYDIGLRHERFK